MRLNTAPVQFPDRTIDLAVNVLQTAIITRAESMPAQIGPDPSDPSHIVKAPQLIETDEVIAAFAELGWIPKPDGSGWQRA